MNKNIYMFLRCYFILFSIKTKVSFFFLIIYDIHKHLMHLVIIKLMILNSDFNLKTVQITLKNMHIKFIFFSKFDRIKGNVLRE